MIKSHYVYKNDHLRDRVTLVAWDNSDNKVNVIANIEDYLLADILEKKMNWKVDYEY